MCVGQTAARTPRGPELHFVIGDSRPWKADLWRIAHRLAGRTEQVRWTEQSFVNLEKDLFLAFFIIRKLMDARKLSVEVESIRVSATVYPWKDGKPINFLNWDHFDDAYEWSKPAEETLSLRGLCNLFVHSYVYSPLMSDDRQLEAVLVSSDHSRHESLFNINVIQIVEVIQAVAGDDPVLLEATLYGATGDYIVRLSQTARRDS